MLTRPILLKVLHFSVILFPCLESYYATIDTYDVFQLDLLAVAKGFGVTDVPKIDLHLMQRDFKEEEEQPKKKRKIVR